MRSGTFSRRSILEASTMFAAPLFFPKLLKAALPDPSEVSPALIEAARKEDVVAFYTHGDSGCRDPREGFRGEVSWGQRPR